ncbi:neutral/alkaline non-lysosomal ceramidase N-terminal domain-containing protein [Paenibacillus nasutitermitis]|uniref:Alkaline ceramidase n=1 Tax=Paenibacillus nasutitermitis TaxID=1652958 RepID=A0A917DUQ8_9BACL|nr:neutral/alkaline non-lysosomal ceramidase N-terminal domain-containing protein [Paenibacillus nasutitermitis]GGD72901.1 alkaline ceramidase [Paenibacillus nasutitermitis]
MLHIGTAKVNITPSRPVPLGGFASRLGLGGFQGVSHPLYARILCFQHSVADGKTTLAVLGSADLLWWGSQMVEALKQRIRELCHVDTVILHGTHTHSGPQIWDGFSEYGGSIDLAYIAELETTVLQGVEAAMSNMEPVTVDIGRGVCDIATNRRSKADDGIRIAPNPNGPVDRELTVLRYKSAHDERTKAVLVHYACHPVVTSDNLISSEFTGVAMEELEQSIGDGAICAYLQGSCGDINPHDGDMGGDAQVVMLGCRLANDVNKVLAGAMRRVDSISLRSVRMSVELPLQALPEREYLESRLGEPGVMGEWSRKLLSRQEGIPASMSLKMTGLALTEGFAVLAMNAEVVVEYGLYLKSASNKTVVPLAYSDGMIGYIPTARQLAEGGYEPIDSTYYFGLPAPFAPEAEGILREALDVVAREFCDAKQS